MGRGSRASQDASAAAFAELRLRRGLAGDLPAWLDGDQPAPPAAPVDNSRYSAELMRSLTERLAVADTGAVQDTLRALHRFKAWRREQGWTSARAGVIARLDRDALVAAITAGDIAAADLGVIADTAAEQHPPPRRARRRT